LLSRAGVITDHPCNERADRSRGRLFEMCERRNRLQVAVDPAAGHDLVAHAWGDPREPDAATPEASATTTADDADTATTDDATAAATDDNAAATATTAAGTATTTATTAAPAAAATTTARGLRRVGANRHDKTRYREGADGISDEQSCGRQNTSQILANHLVSSKFFLRHKACRRLLRGRHARNA
jgi:hypothetical protein